jgi:uncharacterized RDD family membrane protein YckC
MQRIRPAAAVLCPHSSACNKKGTIMARAGFLSRFLAFLIDGIVLSIISWVLTLLFAPFLGAAQSTDPGLIALLLGGIGMVLVVILFFLEFIYFGWLWSRNGQSLGMRVTNIKVLRRDGAALSFLRGGLRGTVGYWISGLVFGLGFLWAAFDGRKEAWHDKLFDTGVFTA